MSLEANLRSVDVVLTAGCNLRCSYCYQNAKQPAARMEWPTLRRALDLLLASDRDEVRLGFYGGEPLLRFEMIRRAVEYVERRRRGGMSVRYGMITNGTLLREPQATFLAEHGVETRVSFDGVPAAQAERGPTFSILDRLLDRLRRRHPRFFEERLSVCVTVLPWALRHLADSVDYFLAKGVEEVRFSPLSTDTSTWRMEQIDELDREFSRVYDRALEHFRETGKVVLEVFRKQGDGKACRSVTRRRLMCGAPLGEALAVDVDGSAFGCLALVRSFQRFPGFLEAELEPMAMGRISDRAFSARLGTYRERTRSARIFRRKQDKHSAYGRCADCRFFHECDLCPVTIGSIPGNEDPDRVPDFLCAFTLVTGRYRERFPCRPSLLEIADGTAEVSGLMRELREHVRMREASRA